MIAIKWQEDDGEWRDFDTSDVMHLPVAHSCHLFSNIKIPVIAKQHDFYVVNSEELKARYRKTGKSVTTFQAILDEGKNLDAPLSQAGFTNTTDRKRG